MCVYVRDRTFPQHEAVRRDRDREGQRERETMRRGGAAERV